MSLRLQKNRRAPPYCSFCGKEKGDVAYLFAGPTVFICNECVELCREIGAMRQKSAPVIAPSHNSGERDPAVTPDSAGADTAPGPRR